jgi:hypothetical protein
MRTSIALALIFAATSVARAQPAPDGPPPGPGGPPPGPPGEPVPPPPAGAVPVAQPPAAVVDHPNTDRGVMEDANSGRSWLMPTALTAPAGTWSFSDYELLVVGVGYSITDTIDVSLGTLIPIAKDQPLVGILTGKAQLAKTGSLRFAAHVMFGFNTGANNTTAGGVGTAGGVATLCLDLACHSHASGYVGVGFATSGQNAVPLAFAGSIVGRLGRHVKLVGELDSAALLGSAYGGTFADGIALWYGLRFTSRNIGVDIGFLEPITKTSTTTIDPVTGMTTTTSASWQVGFGSGALPIGLPFVSFTYRGI